MSCAADFAETFGEKPPKEPDHRRYKTSFRTEHHPIGEGSYAKERFRSE
jgi:hypothetical protein